MKIFPICLALLLISFFANAQSSIYLDKGLSVCKKSQSVYSCKASVENGLIKLDCSNKGDDTLAITVHYANSTLSTLQGLIQYYFPNQKIKQSGNYDNGAKTGIWVMWDSAGHVVDSTLYENGKESTATYYSYYKDTLQFYNFTDSIHDKLHVIFYNSKGNINYEAFYNGQTGIAKDYKDDGTIKTDSVFIREKEASFPGGDQAWKRFVEINLNPNIPVDNGAPRGIYKVIVQFVVGKDGFIKDVKAKTHYGFGMENEVIRLIESSPQWGPGIQYGRNVNSYRLQPVTFSVNNM